MNITAISPLNTGLAQNVTGSNTASINAVDSAFGDIFNGLINNVNTTDATFQSDTVKAAAGELDNPHQLLIDSTKASIALQMFSSVRNNALDAYNDIMKMSV